jgi:hypothetical protein
MEATLAAALDATAGPLRSAEPGDPVRRILTEKTVET